MDMIDRVPTQVAFSNSLFIPCPTAIFPCANLCDLLLFHTQNSSFKQMEIFAANISKYLLPLESGNLQHEETKFPVFWQNFKIPPLGHFPCFPCAVGEVNVGGRMQ